MNSNSTISREKLAQVLIDIEDSDIINFISEKSDKLLDVELERHRRIVDKGREYLRMLLILFGIIIALGSVIFRNYVLDVNCVLSLENGILIFYIISLIFMIIVSFKFFKISYAHDFLWVDFKDLTFIPEVKENHYYFFLISQITNTWFRIIDFRKNNSILISSLARSSKLLIWGILSLFISLILLFIRIYIGE